MAATKNVKDGSYVTDRKTTKRAFAAELGLPLENLFWRDGVLHFSKERESYTRSHKPGTWKGVMLRDGHPVNGAPVIRKDFDRTEMKLYRAARGNKNIGVSLSGAEILEGSSFSPQEAATLGAILGGALGDGRDGSVRMRFTTTRDGGKSGFMHGKWKKES